ncbi:MAG TPA: Rieske (2Fe-2S) protein [Flavobacteriales bacterium]|nr:Rieske (2Fe-2S) protein [Flavobacteriales bacterium]
MQRREFLRSACQACAALALVPVAASMEGCASSAKMMTVENGVLSVPKDTMGTGNTAIVGGQGLANKLMIVKRADGSYTALELLCPHKGGPLKEMGNELTCDWHGSRFDHEGKVLKGPSKADLKTYPVTEDGKVLKVMVG